MGKCALYLLYLYFLRQSSFRREAVDHLLQFSNGDIRKGRVEHWENGCCLDEFGNVDRGKAVMSVFSVMVGAGLLGGWCLEQPSTGRIGSRSAAVACQLAGMMFHNVLKRTWLLTFPPCKKSLRLNGDEEDFHKILKAKAARSRFHLAKEDTPMSAGVISFVSEPVEHCMRCIQQLDEAGGILRILRTAANPFKVCLKDLSTYLSPLHESEELMTLFHHFGTSASDP